MTSLELSVERESFSMLKLQVDCISDQHGETQQSLHRGVEVAGVTSVLDPDFVRLQLGREIVFFLLYTGNGFGFIAFPVYFLVRDCQHIVAMVWS